MPNGQLVKATITNIDTNDTVECMFNPTEYNFSKKAEWKEKSRRGQNVPHLEFSGGKPTELKVQLFFDTYESGEDVRQRYTNTLWKLAMVDSSLRDRKTGKSGPPKCEFRWGSTWAFTAVVTQISQKFTLFLPDGTPVRATLDVTMKQIDDEGLYPRQNPSSGGGEGHRVYTVRQGERLDWIAAQEYGDSSHWQYIAEVNGIDNPMQLRPGMVLKLPPLP